MLFKPALFEGNFVEICTRLVDYSVLSIVAHFVILNILNKK